VSDALGPSQKAEDASTQPPPLYDPYLTAPPRRAELSTLAVSSVVAALLFGPLGAVAAIVFGWAARREIQEAPERRAGYALATAGVVLGVVLTMGWGAALAIGAWTWKHHRGEVLTAEREGAPALPEPARDSSSARQNPEASQSPGGSVPQSTALQRVGALTVVDVGVDAVSLAEELAKQRARSYEVGEKLLVMTTRDPCDPCRGVDRSLSDPLMQTALRGVRLVRVDIDVFKEDLDQLKMPWQRYPGFFLLSLDLTPQDGIDGGEWDDDIPRNIAPVLGAFVRGQHRVRREPWKPLPGSGMRL
jgi:hypothetical protein